MPNIGGFHILKPIIAKHSDGVLGISGHRTEALRDIKIGCTGYARRLQKNEKEVQVYSYVLNNCVQTASTTLNQMTSQISGGRAVSSAPANNPAASVGDKIKARLKREAEKKRKALADKVESKIKNGLSKALSGFGF